MLFCRFGFHHFPDDADHEEGLVELVLQPHVGPHLHPVEKVVENVGCKATYLRLSRSGNGFRTYLIKQMNKCGTWRHEKSLNVYKSPYFQPYPFVQTYILNALCFRWAVGATLSSILK